MGSQIGKSGGAWITQVLMLISGSLTAALPFIGVSWGRVGRGLGRCVCVAACKQAPAARQAASKQDTPPLPAHLHCLEMAATHSHKPLTARHGGRR